MDIRPKQTTETTTKTETTTETTVKFKTGTVPHASGRLMIPPSIQTTLDVLSEKYGLPLNLNEVALDGTLADKIAATRKIVDLVNADSKLLPEMFKLVRKLLKSELRLAEYHKKVVKEAIRFNTTIDKQTSDIFLAMAGYKAKSSKTEHRTNTRAKLIEQRTEAYTKYQEDSVFKNESAVIDAEFAVLASNNKILSESKTQKVDLDNERKEKLNEYVMRAYQN